MPERQKKLLANGVPYYRSNQYYSSKTELDAAKARHKNYPYKTIYKQETYTVAGNVTKGTERKRWVMYQSKVKKTRAKKK